ncbi:MAG: serine hydrolase domain-containing protein [Acidobacteriota bacterium]
MASPEDVGMDAGKLDELKAAMHKVVDEGKLAGVTTVVARKGKVVLFDVYGKADVESGKDLTKDSIFRIYSMTKPIAGVALMTQWEQGKFKLDDPVEKYIPEWKGMKVSTGEMDGEVLKTEAADHAMTMRELMTHTGGLTYGFFSRSAVDTMYQEAGVLDLNSTVEDMTMKLAKIPLRQQPGSQWHYSVSVDVQGYLVEKFSGMPFDEALKKLLFEPLGMNDTDFWVTPAKADRLTTLYVPNRDGGLVAQEQAQTDYLNKPAFFGGGGGLASTAGDYLRFAQMLANGGELDGVRILKPETVKLMHTNHLPESIDFINPMIGNPGNTFGLDFAIVEEPNGTVDHELGKGEYWWYGIGGTWFGINPVQDLIVVGMIQLRGGGAAREVRLESKKMAYEALLDPVR